MKPTRTLSLVLLLVGLSATAASAQIAEARPSKAARLSLKAARKYPAQEDLRRNHLAIDKHALRPGESGQRVRNPDAEQNRYRFDNTGTPRVSEPAYGYNRKKKEKTKQPN